MKPYSYLHAVVIAIASFASQGAASKEISACGKFPPRSQYSEPNASTEGCECGSSLTNVVITLKKPFRLRAVCDLRWLTRDGARPIKLSNERVTFDDYTNHDLPVGELLLIGAATLPGTLRYQPGPAGEFWFYSRRSVGAHGPMKSRLGGFNLYGKHPLRVLGVPTALLRAECWTADATLQVSNIWLLLGDTDEAGAWPSKYKLLDVQNHRPCQ